ncbi:hypothetical protein QL285_014787 [Trifolium repens]|nr:hypothetical protein QL285_014787 [Trifolium repens]
MAVIPPASRPRKTVLSLLVHHCSGKTRPRKKWRFVMQRSNVGEDGDGGGQRRRSASERETDGRRRYGWRWLVVEVVVGGDVVVEE